MGPDEQIIIEMEILVERQLPYICSVGVVETINQVAVLEVLAVVEQDKVLLVNMVVLVVAPQILAVVAEHFEQAVLEL